MEEDIVVPAVEVKVSSPVVFLIIISLRSQINQD